MIIALKNEISHTNSTRVCYKLYKIRAALSLYTDLFFQIRDSEMGVGKGGKSYLASMWNSEI